MSANVISAIGDANRGRRAWLLFFVLGVVAVIASPILLLGFPPDPPSPERFTGLSSNEIAARIPGMPGYVSSIATQLGNFMLTSGVLIAAVAFGPFRRQEKWAWYALWVVPLMLLIQFLNSRGGLGWQFDLGLFFVMIAGLLWPFRLFFPKKGARGSGEGTRTGDGQRAQFQNDRRSGLATGAHRSDFRIKTAP